MPVQVFKRIVTFRDHRSLCHSSLFVTLDVSTMLTIPCIFFLIRSVSLIYSNIDGDSLPLLHAFSNIGRLFLRAALSSMVSAKLSDSSMLRISHAGRSVNSATFSPMIRTCAQSAVAGST